MKSWLAFGDLGLIFKVTAALRLPNLPFSDAFSNVHTIFASLSTPESFKRDLDLIFKVKIGLLFNKSWLGFGNLIAKF